MYVYMYVPLASEMLSGQVSTQNWFSKEFMSGIKNLWACISFAFACVFVVVVFRAMLFHSFESWTFAPHTKARYLKETT